MFRRARSLSRHRGTTPGRETTPSIYDYGAGDDSIGGGGYSTHLNVYGPNLHGSASRSVRAASVARSKDIDDEIILGGGAYDRYHRAQSVSRLDPLKTRRPYSAYGTHDFDYYDRYTERIRDKTPISLDSHYTRYRPLYWYHTAPRTSYYDSSHDDRHSRPLHSHRRSSSAYPLIRDESSYNYRFNDSIGRVTSLKRAMRDLDYTRELRQLRYSTPSTYSTLTHDDNLLNRAREDVRRTVEARAGSSSGLSKQNNPRDYFGRTFVQLEKDDVTDVGVKYTGLSRSVEAKPGTWKAEDVMDMAYDLQAMNNDTVDKLYENKLKIDKNRKWLLQDKAGVAPRLYHFDTNSRQVRRDVNNALRLVRNLKEMKTETFNRLSQPWIFSSNI
ncbi:unnamed protein product [Adineta steineri]|uniref:Uncharacterized protein n=1 Tax=Adineta steineri TaxID=433720 RepID=A0A818PA75_9BILA|nr:unnamed protein product [Adineta steineri]CAF3620060.1 unnamed protein product [Adineta steineri]CAF3620989.1 unnamed protein product [Adineta steineri]